MNKDNDWMKVIPLGMIGLAGTVAAASLASDGKDYGWFLALGFASVYWIYGVLS